MNDFYDLVIVGSGVAGLSALRAAPPTQRIAVCSPGTPLNSGSSWRAQGGVAVALHPEDSPSKHAEDTHKASKFMAEAEAVRILTEAGPERVSELLASGMVCDRDEHGEPYFGLEAAHSRPRVLHHRDRTGRALISHLWQGAKTRPRTHFISQAVVRLLVSDSGVTGVRLQDGSILATPRVILASGGFAGLYQATTTGRDVKGDGLILASEAGAALKDLEFVQFHPTALDGDPRRSLPLLTEALRGAGALLRTQDGERFVDELQPRDVVARAIFSQRLEGRAVFLDLSPVERLRERFPEAATHLGDAAESLLLPVRPAAHYTIGGVETDLDGKTSVAGLYACGEVASVGVHGANRLASNSLLEGLVFGHRAMLAASAQIREARHPQSMPALSSYSDEHDLAELRERFELATGVVRTASGLKRFLDWLEDQPGHMEARLAALVAQAALDRAESVGAHYRADEQLSPSLANVV